MHLSSFVKNCKIVAGKVSTGAKSAVKVPGKAVKKAKATCANAKALVRVKVKANNKVRTRNFFIVSPSSFRFSAAQYCPYSEQYHYQQYRHVSNITLEKYREMICWFFTWAYQEEYIQNISNIKKANISVEDLEYVIFLGKPEPKQIKLEPIKEVNTNKDKTVVASRQSSPRKSVPKKPKHKPNTVKGIRLSPNIFAESENEVHDINQSQSDCLSEEESVVNINMNVLTCDVNTNSNSNAPNTSNANTPDTNELHFSQMINELKHSKQPVNKKTVSFNISSTSVPISNQQQQQPPFKTYENSIKQILSLPKTRNKDISFLNTNITSIFNAVASLASSSMSDKLNIVFDLDSTLLHSTMNKFPDKERDRWSHNPNLFHFEITIEQHPFKGICIFRPGLREFFTKTKSFCNYYIYSMGRDEYAKHLSEKLQETFNIDIVCTYGRIETFERQKFLQKIGLNTSNTLIIDDQVEVWMTENNGITNASCLINSYKFLSELIIKNFGNYTQLDFYPFCYSYTHQSKQFQLYFKTEESTFIIGVNHVPYHIEHENSEKFQFEYIGDLLRKVALLMNHAHIDAYLALTCIKSTVLLGVKVYLGFVSNFNTPASCGPLPRRPRLYRRNRLALRYHNACRKKQFRACYR